MFQICDILEPFKKKLSYLGILKGMQLQISAHMPFDGPVVILLSGRKIALRLREFQCLVLKKLG
jgi:Fe2+ transport system protein FeoA